MNAAVYGVLSGYTLTRIGSDDYAAGSYIVRDRLESRQAAEDVAYKLGQNCTVRVGVFLSTGHGWLLCK